MISVIFNKLIWPTNVIEIEFESGNFRELAN